jgi:hypothetical protein
MTKVLVDQQLLCDLFNFNRRDPEYQKAYAAIRDLLEAPELPPQTVGISSLAFSPFKHHGADAARSK